MQAQSGTQYPKGAVPSVPGNNLQEEDGLGAGSISGVMSAQKQSKTV